MNLVITMIISIAIAGLIIYTWANEDPPSWDD
jgi:hypothetical protein